MRPHPAALSEAGAAACDLAEEVATSWLPGATQRDRAGRFDVALIEKVQLSGLAGCCVPVELGGLGLTQLGDLVAVVHRLAAADASLALAVHMHLSASWSLARAWRANSDRHGSAGEGENERTTLLFSVGAGRSWLSAAVTEAGTNFFHPRTTLNPRPEGGWVLRGTKIFATGSPAATHFSVNSRITAGPQANHLAQLFVPAASPGVHVEDDWDGLGMRASGSGAVRFEDVVLPASTLVLVGGPYGRFSAASLCGRAFGNVGNVVAMAAIAWAAEALAIERVTGASRVVAAPLAARATVRASLAELSTDAFVLQAVVETLTRRADEVANRLVNDPASVHHAAAVGFMADFQAAKLAINRLAAGVVDRALSLAGGTGYTASHPLARLTRDVRAGQFMQPFSPHESLGFLGAVAAGVEPDAEA